MKKFIMAVLLLAVSLSTFAQQEEKKEFKKAMTRQDFFEKSKSEKTTARVLLIGGGALVATSILIAAPGRVSFDLLGLLAAAGVIGLVGTIVSIHFFSASEKSHRKGMAASAFIKMEKINVLPRSKIGNQCFPSVALHIHLP